MNTSISFRALAVASAALLATLALVPAISFAAELRAGDQPTVGSSEIITNDLYIVGGSVTSSGKIQGDLITAGGNILVTGPVTQDVAAAGGSITILGTVGDTIRVTGGNIIIGSTVHNDIVAAGGQIQITGGQVGRDVVIAGGSVRIDSPVMGNVRFTGGELYINAPVSGNVEANGQKVTLGSAAVVSGNLTYKTPKEVVMNTGAQVKGVVSYTPRTIRANGFDKQAFAGFITFWFFAKLLMILAGALVLGLLLRRYSEEIVQDAFTQPLAGLGRGLVALFVLPAVSVLLLITVVGIPFGVLGILGFVILFIVSSLTAPILMGSMLYKWMYKGDTYEVSWKTITLGVLAYFICGLIPILGWVVVLGFWLLTLGAIVQMKLRILKEWR